MSVTWDETRPDNIFLRMSFSEKPPRGHRIYRERNTRKTSEETTPFRSPCGRYAGHGYVISFVLGKPQCEKNFHHVVVLFHRTPHLFDWSGEIIWDARFFVGGSKKQTTDVGIIKIKNVFFLFSMARPTIKN